MCIEYDEHTRIERHAQRVNCSAFEDQRCQVIVHLQHSSLKILTRVIEQRLTCNTKKCRVTMAQEKQGRCFLRAIIVHSAWCKRRSETFMTQTSKIDFSRDACVVCNFEEPLQYSKLRRTAYVARTQANTSSHFACRNSPLLR